MTQLEEQIKLLVELQGLDTNIRRMEAELASVPVKIKEMEDAFSSKTTNLKKLEDESKALTLKRKDKEGEMEGKEGAIKKYQSQLYQVKTNKEYSALQDEIGRAKADNSVIEEEIIRILDQIDAKAKEIAQEREVVKSEEVSLGQEKKKMEAQASVVKDELDGVKIKRAELAARVDVKSLAKYERLLKNKDGLAIVPVANDSCQGCFSLLPPQVINEIRMKEDLVVCESCARILYIAE